MAKLRTSFLALILVSLYCAAGFGLAVAGLGGSCGGRRGTVPMGAL